MIIGVYRKVDAFPLICYPANQQNSKQIQIMQQISQQFISQEASKRIVNDNKNIISIKISRQFITMSYDQKQQFKLLDELNDQLVLSYEQQSNQISQQYSLSGQASQQIEQLINKYQQINEMDQLNSELDNVKSIMQENLESLLNRGQNLNQIEDESIQLVQNTKDVLVNAKELDAAAFMRQYYLYIIIAVIVLLFIIVKLL